MRSNFSSFMAYSVTFFTALVCSFYTFVASGSNEILTTNESMDKLKDGSWLVLVHESDCRDSLCEMYKRAFLVLKNDSEIQAENIRLATLDASKYRLSARQLISVGDGRLPALLLVMSGRIYHPKNVFERFNDIKEFALSEGAGHVRARDLDSDLEKDFGPVASSIFAVCLLLLGITAITFLAGRGVFQPRDSGYREVPETDLGMMSARRRIKAITSKKNE